MSSLSVIRPVCRLPAFFCSSIHSGRMLCSLPATSSATVLVFAAITRAPSVDFQGLSGAEGDGNWPGEEGLTCPLIPFIGCSQADICYSGGPKIGRIEEAAISAQARSKKLSKKMTRHERRAGDTGR